MFMLSYMLGGRGKETVKKRDSQGTWSANLSLDSVDELAVNSQPGSPTSQDPQDLFADLAADGFAAHRQFTADNSDDLSPASVEEEGAFVAAYVPFDAQVLANQALLTGHAPLLQNAQEQPSPEAMRDSVLLLFTDHIGAMIDMPFRQLNNKSPHNVLRDCSQQPNTLEALQAQAVKLQGLLDFVGKLGQEIAHCLAEAPFGDAQAGSDNLLRLGNFSRFVYAINGDVATMPQCPLLQQVQYPHGARLEELVQILGACSTENGDAQPTDLLIDFCIRDSIYPPLQLFRQAVQAELTNLQNQQHSLQASEKAATSPRRWPKFWQKEDACRARLARWETSLAATQEWSATHWQHSQAWLAARLRPLEAKIHAFDERFQATREHTDAVVRGTSGWLRRAVEVISQDLAAERAQMWHQADVMRRIVRDKEQYEPLLPSAQPQKKMK